MKKLDANSQRFALGRELDARYRIGEELGRGGLGTVYRGTHKQLGKAVAIKLLHEDHGHDATVRARFEREAKALATLAHSNVVAVLDYGISGNAPYLVMELLEGETLAARLARGALDRAHGFALARTLLSTLAFVHARGLVHRDLKPSNVFLQRVADGSECLKLLDFGLAKFTTLRAGRDDATLTHAGHVLGTPAYMAPEQIGGDALDARSDVYALGVILFQMLAGRLPFEGEAAEQLRAHLAVEPPALSAVCAKGSVSAPLDAFLKRAMMKAPEDRFRDAAAMLEALDALPAGFGAARETRATRAESVRAALAFAPTEVAPAQHARRSKSAPGGALAAVERFVRGLVLAGARLLSVLAVLVIALALAAIYLAQHRPRHASDKSKPHAEASP